MLKKILYGFLAVIAATVIISLFLPGSVHVERSLEMDAPAAKIFPLINDLKLSEKWSPWFEKDPSMEITWGDKTVGVGASYCWKGDPDLSGTGCMEISESIENKSLTTKLDFDEQGTAVGGWVLEESDSRTRVTWGFDTDVSSPPVIGKYFGLMMNGFVGPDFEKGLSNMKEYVESVPDYSIEIVDAELGPIHYIFIRNVSSIENLGTQMGASAGILGAYMGKNGLEMGGNVFSMYYSFGEEVDYSFCFPVSEEVAVNHENIQYGFLEEGKYIRGTHYGPYENLNSSYEEMERFMGDSEMVATGGPVEVYITDPGSEPDPAKWLTYIYFPVGG
jgi:effector-binding domain-containing protein